MEKILNRLRTNKFKTHLAIFLTIILSSIGMYLAAAHNQTSLIWVLLVATVCANLLALITK